MPYLGSQQLLDLLNHPLLDQPTKTEEISHYRVWRHWAQPSAPISRAGKTWQGGHCKLHTPCSSPLAGGHQPALKEAFTWPFCLEEDKESIGEGGEGEPKRAEPRLSGTENKNLYHLWKLSSKEHQPISRISPPHHQGAQCFHKHDPCRYSGSAGFCHYFTLFWTCCSAFSDNSITSLMVAKKFCWAKICLNFLAAYGFSCTGRKPRHPAQAFFLSLQFSGICSGLADLSKQLGGKQFKYGYFPSTPSDKKIHTELPNLSPKSPHERSSLI